MNCSTLATVGGMMGKPSGDHDDGVMALALSVWGCHTFGVGPGRTLRLGCDRGRRPEGGARWSATLV
jgi:hypothetical protein